MQAADGVEVHPLVIEPPMIRTEGLVTKGEMVLLLKAVEKEKIRKKSCRLI